MARTTGNLDGAGFPAVLALAAGVPAGGGGGVRGRPG